MSEILTLPDATARIAQVLERASRGEEFVVTLQGAPAVRIGPAEREVVPPSPPPAATEAAAESRPVRRNTFGMFAHWGTIGPEFFEPLPDDELRRWEGDSE